jgi:BirA family biotin operon repressor/biotin-[acetyl-CoA-carboxylase] ligase
MTLLTFDTIDSTNNYVKEHANQLAHFTVVRARYQTAGRGQFNRQWQSNPNENLLVSFFLKTFKKNTTVQTIEQVLLQSCHHFFKHFGLTTVHKLPNDLMVQGKKIAGMLIETKQTDGKLDHVILGIGLNINQQSFDNLSTATSIALISKKIHPIDDVFEIFLTASKPLLSL